MTTTNEISENNNILVRIRIPDATGHTTIEERIDEAIRVAATKHFTESKWTMVGPTIFEFTAKDVNDTKGLLNDTIRLREMLTNAATTNKDGQLTVTMTLTGALQGGC